MFDIGFFEIAVIGVVLLVVMGPEKLPEVARQGAFFVRKARAWLTDMKSEMDTQTDGGLSSFKEATREIAELKASISKMGQDVMAEVDETSNKIQDSVADVENDYADLDAESYFNKLINEDVEPSLVDDEVAGKPEKKVTKKATAKKGTTKKALAKETFAKKATKKASATPTTAKKVTAKKATPAKKAPVKKASTAKKPVAKKKTATPRKKIATEKT